MYQPDWETYLRLIASHKEMTPAVKDAFMNTFITCDPNNPLGNCSPVIVSSKDRNYDSYRKSMGKVFKKLGCSEEEIDDADKVSKSANLVLPWLLNEYQKPTFPWWKGSPENNINIQRLQGYLQSLNYTSQSQLFENETNDVNLSKIFLVHASSILTQKWLVKRLSSKITSHVVSEKITISASAKWNRSPEFFWESLREYTKVQEPEEIIKVLAGSCLQKPLIMAIYDTQELEACMLTYLVDNFWRQLIQEVEQKSCQGEREDFILFLTANSNASCEIDLQDTVRLDSWDRISVSDLNLWLKDRSIRQFLLDCDGSNSDLMPLNGELSGDIETMLSRICKAFNVYDKQTLEKCWRLV
jgi:hypothetical protein